MRGPRLLSCVACLAATVALLPAAPAAADDLDVAVAPDGRAHVSRLGAGGRVLDRVWSPDGALLGQVPVSPMGQSTVETDAAVDAAGGAYHVWHRTDGTTGIRGRRVGADGRLGPVEILSNGAGLAYGPPRTAVAPDGDALVVWSRQLRDTGFSVIEARRSSAAGVLGPVLTLSPRDRSGYHPAVAVDADGDALVVWLQHGVTERIEARVVGAEGAPGEQRTLSSGEGEASAPEVGMSDAGDAIVVWRRATDRGTTPHLKERSADGTHSKTFPLRSSAGHASPPRLAVAGNGAAMVAWSASAPDGPVVEARFRTADDRLRPRVQVSDDPDSGNPDVAIDEEGSALIVWERFGAEGTTVIQARRRLQPGTYGPIQDVSPPGRPWRPAVDMDADGDSVVVWDQVAEGMPVEGRRRSSAGRLGPLTRLSD